MRFGAVNPFPSIPVCAETSVSLPLKDSKNISVISHVTGEKKGISCQELLGTYNQVAKEQQLPPRCLR